jgi:aspartyl-tRNA(Asn)/glutamyl-tRNA(Gln) amidotransferase subunit C
MSSSPEPHSSAVTPETVRQIATLARLRLPEQDLALWSRQLSRILDYIDQLKRIPEEAFGAPAAGPATPLRDDASRPGHGEEALEANAPRRLHGYGVVPRVVGSGQG